MARHPWLNAENSYMVLGHDLDAIVSAVLMNHLRGWRIAGFYNLREVCYSTSLRAEDLLDAVWIDLDISRQNIKSIGHHILRVTESDQLPYHQESLNPNLLRGITAQPGRGLAGRHGANCRLCGGDTFPHKYPMGTIHFLLWLYNVPINSPNPVQIGFLWHPDSTWILAQSGHYELNVRDWVANFVSHPFLTRTITTVDTLPFEQNIQSQVFPPIQAAGFKQGKAQRDTISNHLKLFGYQCRFSKPELWQPQIQTLANLVAHTFGWPRLPVPANYRCIRGERDRSTVTTLQRICGSLDNFVSTQDVFSYVIGGNNAIDYTVGIRL